MSYDHKQALEDLIGQVRAMKERSDEYFKIADAEVPGNATAEKHLRVFCVLKELERLGREFAARAGSEMPKTVTQRENALESLLMAVERLGKIKNGKTLFEGDTLRDPECYEAYRELHDARQKARELLNCPQ